MHQRGKIHQTKQENEAHTTIKMAALHSEIYVQMHILRFQQRVKRNT